MNGRSFGDPFERAPLDAIFRYAYYADRVEYEFLDPELEAARREFADAARRFTRGVSLNTWVMHREGYSSVPLEWQETQPDRFDGVVAEIDENAEKVENAYAQSVRLARRRLGVVGVIEPATSEAQ